MTTPCVSPCTSGACAGALTCAALTGGRLAPTGNGLYSKFRRSCPEGNLVAIGVQHSSTKTDISIADIRSGRTNAQFYPPAGLRRVIWTFVCSLGGFT
jgi:hypothetical protein